VLGRSWVRIPVWPGNCPTITYIWHPTKKPTGLIIEESRLYLRFINKFIEISRKRREEYSGDWYFSPDSSYGRASY